MLGLLKKTKEVCHYLGSRRVYIMTADTEEGYVWVTYHKQSKDWFVVHMSDLKS